MYTPKLHAIPQVYDLRAFVPILGQEQVTQIDGQRKDAVGKVADCIQAVLSDRSLVWHHIYQSFYFDVPGDLYTALVNSNLVDITGHSRGGAVFGIATASFYKWKLFLDFALDKGELEVLRTALFTFLVKFEPFKNVDPGVKYAQLPGRNVS